MTTTGQLEAEESSGESGVRAVNNLFSLLPVGQLASLRLSQADSLLGFAPDPQLQLS